MNAWKLLALTLAISQVGCSRNRSDEQLFTDLRVAYEQAKSADDATAHFPEVERLVGELEDRKLVIVESQSFADDATYNERLNEIERDGSVVYWEGDPESNQIQVYRRR